MKQFHVYKITNLINGKVYIGKTNDLKKRWSAHKCDAKKPQKRKHAPILAAINKYGVENFSMESVEITNTNKKVLKLERKWIKAFRKKGYDIYNVSDGGESPPHYIGNKNPSAKINPEIVGMIRYLLDKGYKSIDLSKVLKITAAIISYVKLNKTWQHIDPSFKVKPSDETLHELNEHIANKPNTRLGKKHTEETKKKISGANKGKPSPNKGKSMSELQKLKISKTRRAAKISVGASNPKAKLNEQQVIQIIELLKKDVAQRDIASMFNIDTSTVSNIRVGKTWSHLKESSRMERMYKLTEENVRTIKQLLHNNIELRAIANQFNVSTTTIRDIRTGKTWSHILI
jgi:group I intron endonuclease